MRKHDWKLIQLVIIGLSLSALLLIQACGVYKSRDEQVLVVEHNSGNTTASSSDGLLDSFKEIYYLYADKDGIGRTQVTNILNKYKPLIEKRLAGQSLDLDQLLDVLFSIDEAPNGDANGKIDLSEISKTIQSFPAIRWITGESNVSKELLRLKILQEYPYASKAVLDGYIDSLFLFSEDGQNLRRRDILIPTLIMSILFERLDLKGDYTPSKTDSTQKRLAFQQLQIKLSQQIFSRDFIVFQKQWLEHVLVEAPLLGAYLKSGQTTVLAKPLEGSQFPDAQNYLVGKILHNKILRPGSDRQMEWMQLSLKYLKVHQVLSEYDGDIRLDDTDSLTSAFEKLGTQNPSQYLSLASLYDSSKTGGRRNGRLDTLEFFNLWTDILYFQSINENLHRLLLPGLYLATPAIEERLYTLDHLLALFPHTGKDLFLKDVPENVNQISQSLRWSVWEDAFQPNPEHLKTRIKRVLTAESFLNFMVSVRLVESVYMIYDDENGKADGLMTIKETQKFLDLLGLGTAQAARLFFINSSDFAKAKDLTPDQMEDLIRGKKCPKSLRPHEFYERLKNLNF